MAEISTPALEHRSSVTAAPRSATLAFIRQFARCYHPLSTGGIILN
ncbi:MAG: hypothetical protein K2M97_02360 [Muribaculaceae bacterium]|nr:hypothetical protein [Muribaculaceae bacterium]